MGCVIMGYICSSCYATLTPNQYRCPKCGGRRERDGEGINFRAGKTAENTNKRSGFVYMTYDADGNPIAEFNTAGEAKRNYPEGGSIGMVLRIVG